MQNAALAERFDDVSQGLRATGHGVIMRKARSLLENGDLDGATAFIERAGSRMAHGELNGLVTALKSWAEDGGDIKALVGEATWTASKAREDQASSLIAEVIESGDDLSTMADALALEQMALSEKEPVPSLPPMPERTTQPEEPAIAADPVEPEAAPEAAEPEAAEPEAPAEPVEPEAAAGAVEKPSTLEARSPDFDDSAEDVADTVAEVPAIDTPAEPEVPAGDAVAAADDDAVDAAGDDEPAAEDAPVEPETPAEDAVEASAEDDTPAKDGEFGGDKTTEPVVQKDAPPATEDGGSGMWILLAIAAIAAGAYFFFTR